MSDYFLLDWGYSATNEKDCNSFFRLRVKLSQSFLAHCRCINRMVLDPYLRFYIENTFHLFYNEAPRPKSTFLWSVYGPEGPTSRTRVLTHRDKSNISLCTAFYCIHYAGGVIQAVITVASRHHHHHLCLADEVMRSLLLSHMIIPIASLVSSLY